MQRLVTATGAKGCTVVRVLLLQRAQLVVDALEAMRLHEPTEPAGLTRRRLSTIWVTGTRDASGEGRGVYSRLGFVFERREERGHDGGMEGTAEADMFATRVYIRVSAAVAQQ